MILVVPVARVHLDSLVTLDYQEQLDQLARLGSVVIRDFREVLDSLEHPDHKDPLEIQDHRGSQALTETLDQLVLLGRMVLLVQWAA